MNSAQMQNKAALRRPARPGTVRRCRREWLRLAAMVAMASTLASVMAACGETAASTDAVSLEAARAEHEAGRAVLIDIREPEKHATGAAAGARLLPMRQLS